MVVFLLCGIRPDPIHDMTRELGWEKNAVSEGSREFAFDGATLGGLVETMVKRLNAHSMRVVGDAMMPVKRVVANWGYASLIPKCDQDGGAAGCGCGDLRRDTGVGAGGVCAGSDRCGREEGTDRGEPCGVGAVRDAVLRGVAEAEGAGGFGGVYGEQGAILGGAELGWGPGPDLPRCRSASTSLQRSRWNVSCQG